MPGAIITIGREYASGGRQVAKRVAQELALPYYDKELITLAAQETGLAEEFIREAEQTRTSSLLYNMYMTAQTLPAADKVFLAQSNIIRRFAQAGPCVILGRCANCVLREHANIIRVFLYAPLSERIRRAQEEYGLDEDIVKATIAKNDKGRASYYNHFTTGQWGARAEYDLLLSTHIGIEQTARVIVELYNGYIG